MIKPIQLLILFLFLNGLTLPVFGATDWCTDSDIGGCWKFEDNGTQLDESSNNNDCTKSGTINQQVTGKYDDYAIEWIQSNNAKYSCGSSASLNLNPISTAIWIAPDDDGNHGFVDCKAGCIWDKSRHAWGLNVGTTTTEIRLLYHWDGGNAVWQDTTDEIQLDGTWQHVAVTYDNSSTSNDATMYYNGVASFPDSSPCCGSADSLSGTLYLGIEGVSNVSEFDGDFDELIWWGGTSEMSSTDINEVMDCGIDGTQSGAGCQVSTFTPKVLFVKKDFGDGLVLYMKEKS